MSIHNGYIMSSSGTLLHWDSDEFETCETLNKFAEPGCIFYAPYNYHYWDGIADLKYRPEQVPEILRNAPVKWFSVLEIGCKLTYPQLREFAVWIEDDELQQAMKTWDPLECYIALGTEF